MKTQTPLGIFFKNQSVMETHHCSVSGMLASANFLKHCGVVCMLLYLLAKSIASSVMQAVLSSAAANILVEEGRHLSCNTLSQIEHTFQTPRSCQLPRNIPCKDMNRLLVRLLKKKKMLISVLFRNNCFRFLFCQITEVSIEESKRR